MPDLIAERAQILNDSRLVREYTLARTPHERAARARAIERLGRAVRDAFNKTDDFEPLLAAIVDGLKPRDERVF